MFLDSLKFTLLTLIIRMDLFVVIETNLGTDLHELNFFLYLDSDYSVSSGKSGRTSGYKYILKF
jgi:hypothetical protein